MVLSATVFVSAGPASAEVVLCKPAHQGAVQAREGACKIGETELTKSESSGTLAAGYYTNMTPANVTGIDVATECDAHENVYQVKNNTPLN